MPKKKFDLDDIIERVEKGEEPLEDIKAEVDAELEAVMPEELLRAHRVIHHPDFLKNLELPKPVAPEDRMKPVMPEDSN